MSIFKGIKGKVTATIMVGAMVTGAGAAAASGFSEHIYDKVTGVVSKAADYAAFFVNKNAEKQEDAVEAKVASEFDSAARESAKHFSNELNRGYSEVNSYSTGYQGDIEAAANQYIEYTKGEITKSVDAEVYEAKMEIDAAAKAKADLLLDKTSNSIGTVPAQPAE